MKEIHTKSTSKSSAVCTDIVLRETKTTRLIFRPLLIDNPQNPQATVNGGFLFQRKKGSEWEDFDTIPLSSIKGGEGYKLELHSEELLQLFQELHYIYELRKVAGIPPGQTKFIKASPELEQLAQLTTNEISTFLQANRAVGSSLLGNLLNWAVNADEPSPLIEKLLALGPDSLIKLNTAVSVQSLKLAVKTWDNNIKNDNEEFWQSSLTQHSFVLEQIFSWPVSIVKGKAYMGGKSVMNQGGNVVDFLMKNQLTHNAALIEIKTPITPLIGSEYRDGGIYNISRDIAGSMMQILNYKHSLLKNYQNITERQGDLFSAFNPNCVIIIGNTKSLDHVDKVRCFELFRRQLHDLQIITYDELFNKTKQVIGLMEGTRESNMEEDDIPF